MKKTKLIISKMLILVACIPLLFSFVKIIEWNVDNSNTSKKIEKIQETVITEEVEDTVYTNIVSESENIETRFLQVEFDTLLAQNSETKGWINIPGTNIDYPFVQRNNNDYYLFHSYDKSWNDAGWIFLDYRNDITDLNTNTIIYGHGRLDGSMFGSLRDTTKEEWLSNKDNQVVKVSTLSNNYLFEVFSIYTIKTTNDYLYNNFNSVEEYNSFLTKITNRSIYNFNVEATTKDKIITLSTCYDNTYKLVLHAKLIKQQKRY